MRVPPVAQKCRATADASFVHGTLGTVDVDDVAGRMSFSGAAGFAENSRQGLARRSQKGLLRRIRRGVYGDAIGDAPAIAMARADYFRERYLERILAVVGTRQSPHVVSHESAAALWELPIFSPWPREVHTLVPPSSRAVSRNAVRVHRGTFDDDADTVLIGSVRVTTPARTIFDMARSARPENALVALDFARNRKLARAAHSVEVADIEAQLERAVSSRGTSIARAVLEFSVDCSGSPGETMSRVILFRVGFPRPLLQVRHASSRVAYYETDFEWPEARLIGEFDGRGKYLKSDLVNPSEAGEVVYEEKLREDELRSEGNGVVRWGWPELRQPLLLRDRLMAAGLPLVRRPSAGLGPW